MPSQLSAQLPLQGLTENATAKLAENMLYSIGEDPHREGLIKTPERFAKAMRELTAGYHITAEEAVGEGIFSTESTGPVFVNQLEFFSLCEHHMLPFWGHASIGYIPNRKILGLSKLARVLEVYGRRLQVQERLTREIAESIFKLIDAKAVVVKVEAHHMCMMMRGVRKQDSMTRTEFHLGFENLTGEERGRMWTGIDSK
jgi:GTP cyclohydrolase I